MAGVYKTKHYFDVNRSVKIVGVGNVTILGNGRDCTEAGFLIRDNTTSVIIKNLKISSVSYGIEIKNKPKTVVIEGVRIRDTYMGVLCGFTSTNNNSKIILYNVTTNKGDINIAGFEYTIINKVSAVNAVVGLSLQGKYIGLKDVVTKNCYNEGITIQGLDVACVNCSAYGSYIAGIDIMAKNASYIYVNNLENCYNGLYVLSNFSVVKVNSAKNCPHIAALYGRVLKVSLNNIDENCTKKIHGNAIDIKSDYLNLNITNTRIASNEPYNLKYYTGVNVTSKYVSGMNVSNFTASGLKHGIYVNGIFNKLNFRGLKIKNCSNGVYVSEFSKKEILSIIEELYKKYKNNPDGFLKAIKKLIEKFEKIPGKITVSNSEFYGNGQGMFLLSLRGEAYRSNFINNTVGLSDFCLFFNGANLIFRNNTMYGLELAVNAYVHNSSFSYNGLGSENGSAIYVYLPNVTIRYSNIYLNNKHTVSTLTIEDILKHINTSNSVSGVGTGTIKNAGVNTGINGTLPILYLANASYNYWGTTNLTSIGASTHGYVKYTPILVSPAIIVPLPEIAPAFLAALGAALVILKRMRFK